MKAILYCRVSHEEQTKGYSLKFQEDEGREYAAKHGMEIVKIFTVQESASKQGREVFNEAVDLIRSRKDVSAFLVWKQDRAIRNLQDLALVDALAREDGKEIHFFHEGKTYTKDSNTSDFYLFGFQGIMNTGFSRNNADLTRTGLLKKAESGQFPGKPLWGYRMNRETRKLELDQERAPWVIRVKELAAEGQSLNKIMTELRAEGCSHRFWPSFLVKIIRNTFYSGLFTWAGKTYEGQYPVLVDKILHDAAVAGYARSSRPRPQSRIIAYRGLIRCGFCNALVTGEHKKGKYVYYACAARRGNRCKDAEYVEEKDLDRQIEVALDRIKITPDHAKYLVNEIEQDAGIAMATRESKLALLRGERTRLETRIKKAYVDKVDGKLEESRWLVQDREWQDSLVSVKSELKKVEASKGEEKLDAAKVLELANSLKTQFKRFQGVDKGIFVDCIFSNFSLRAKTLSLTYEILFAEFVKQAENKLGVPKCKTLEPQEVQQFYQILVDHKQEISALARMVA